MTNEDYLLMFIVAVCGVFLLYGIYQEAADVPSIAATIHQWRQP